MVGLLGEEAGRGRRRAGTIMHQLHLSYVDVASYDPKIVERELAIETPLDVMGNVLVLD